MDQPQRAFTPPNAPIKDAKLLPVQAPAQIFGRNRELGSGHVALKAGTAIFLHGAAGIGKTAVAAVLATGYTAQNPGGVLWFNLTEDDADLLLARVGRAYGVNALTTNQDPAERVSIVRALLERNRPLIVLDGLTDADSVREFARSAAAGIPMIVANDTQVAGPWTPMALKPLAAVDSAQMLRTLSGLQDIAYGGDIDGLCRVLDGEPLALEIAGRLIAADDITPAELLTAFLGAVPPGIGRPDPQQTMFSVAYKRLQPAVQGIFLILGVTFAGGASAELISDLSSVPAPQVSPIMHQMVARGLVHESVSYGQLRFTAHESAQAFARRLLEAGGRLRAVENRVLEAVVVYTLRHARPEPANHDRLAAELDNIMGAAAYATSTHQEQPLRQIVGAFGQQSGDFVTVRGFQPELAQLRKLMVLFGRPEFQEEAAPPPVTPPEPPPEAPPPSSLVATQPSAANATQPIIPVETPAPALSFKSLFDQAPAKAAPVEAAPAEAPAEPPITEPEPLPDAEATPPSQSTPLAPPLDEPIPAPVVAEAAPPDLPDEPPPMSSEPTAPATAVTALEPAPTPEAADEPTALSVGSLQARITEAKSRGDTQALVGYLQQLGDLQVTEADAAGAVNSYTQAVEAARGSENWIEIGVLMGKLGNAYIDAGRAQEAALMLEQALTIFRRERRSDYETWVLGTLGSAYGDLRDWAKAQDHFQQALYLARERRDPLQEATQLGNIAYMRALQGDASDAILNYRQGLHVAYLISNDALRGQYLYELGRLLIDDGRTLNQAMQLLSEAEKELPGDAEIQRLLKRARKRLEHLKAGGVDIPGADSNEQYAAGAYAAPVA